MQYERVCSIDGAEVPYEEIGRGYVSSTGELVVLNDVDLAMLPAKQSRSIEVISLLPITAVDPIYLDRSYYVEPEPQGAKAYRLLRDALSKQGRVAVAKFTLRDREIVAVLRVHAEVLILATMLWPDEVREPRFPFLADNDEWSAPSQELAMAEALINSLSDQKLDPGRYRDMHRETLTALVDAKASGRTPTEDARGGVAPLDLLSALRASIEAAKQRRSTGNGGPRRTPRSADTAKKASAGAAKKKPKKAVSADVRPARRRSAADPEVRRELRDTPGAMPHFRAVS